MSVKGICVGNLQHQFDVIVVNHLFICLSFLLSTDNSANTLNAQDIWSKAIENHNENNDSIRN